MSVSIIITSGKIQNFKKSDLSIYAIKWLFLTYFGQDKLPIHQIQKNKAKMAQKTHKKTVKIRTYCQNPSFMYFCSFK
jgi:hypothetical protein